MRTRLESPKPASIFIATLALGLAGATAAGAAELLAGVASKNRLVVFASDKSIDTVVVPLTGLQPGETILGLDTRPATGALYALGSTSRLYTIDIETGVATAVGTEPFATLLEGDEFGFDFNPTVDRIRIVSNANQNMRAHPDTGAIAFVDADLAYASDDSGVGLTPDVTAAAYINNDNDPATPTTLYDIDESRGVLVIQNPPNDGVLRTVGPLERPFKSVEGFDVAGSDGTAYMAAIRTSTANPSSDRAVLYTVDLETGEATPLGKIAGPKGLGSLTALGSLD